MILINFTPNSSGGGKYHASKFINTLIATVPKNSIVLALNKNMTINTDGIITYFLESPSTSFKSRRKLKEIVKEHEVKLVFTMAGPAFVKFKAFHIMGLSNAWLLRKNDRLLLEGYPKILNKIFVWLKINYTRLHICCADHFIFQTELSRNEFVKQQPNVSISNSTIIPNAIINDNDLIKSKKKLNQSFVKHIIIPSNYYPHKGLNEVVSAINKLTTDNIAFYFTLSENNFMKIDGILRKNIFNLGEYTPFEERDLLSKFDAIVLPSKLETCSGTMLEACMLQKVIITRESGFSREIFGESANYFRNQDDLTYLINNLSSLTLFKNIKKEPIQYSKRTDQIIKMIQHFKNVL